MYMYLIYNELATAILWSTRRTEGPHVKHDLSLCTCIRDSKQFRTLRTKRGYVWLIRIRTCRCGGDEFQLDKLFLGVSSKGPRKHASALTFATYEGRNNRVCDSMTTIIIVIIILNCISSHVWYVHFVYS